MKKLILLSLAILALSSCNKHFMTLSMLQEQLDPDVLSQITQKKTVYYGSFEVFKISYEPNGLQEIICINKESGKKVALSINKDTALVIKDKNGKKHVLYLDTVHVNDTCIFGFYSRMINDPQMIPFDQVEKIEIHSELSKERALE